MNAGVRTGKAGPENGVNASASCKHANAPQDTVTAERYERALLHPKRRAE